MALKKSDLYSSLWASCDQLRGGMDASQYKDYVLFMLFIKYVSDKYGKREGPFTPVKIPKGAGFEDMVKLKGKIDIGDRINTQIVGPLIDANDKLARSDFPDFNDPNKLGQGQEMVDRLTNLIAIFENPQLDFTDNRADHDDILGDAYEYLIRHFATESGKSKGQFYTPSEVSRVIAQVIGISPETAKPSTTAYDPTCGSGSLLLKIGEYASGPKRTRITLEGQEKDMTTAGLARMNMILHDFPSATIVSGNTLSSPKFTDGEKLRTYDYVVANPPFSDKGWSNGLTPPSDPFQRFSWGEPPAKQGDYAYLLHIIRSIKPDGKAACVLPHGVLFRGNAEAVIRQNLVKSGYLAGIIGLPPNLFFGTGIPACILVLDKASAQTRKDVFIIDASKGFMKDGPKNRMREMDVHRIVDTYNKRTEVPGYARAVPFADIEKNEFNLNIPRYVDSQDVEDIEDIGGHLLGGIPARDLQGLQDYWQVCPTLRNDLLWELRPSYFALTVETGKVRETVFSHPEFVRYIESMKKLFESWSERFIKTMSAIGAGCHPKDVIHQVSEDLLESYKGKPLIKAYEVYQHLMNYWAETMQDDLYLVSADGWQARPERIIETAKNGKAKDKGWKCNLLPSEVIVRSFFSTEQDKVAEIESEIESLSSRQTELEEEFGGEEGVFGEMDGISASEVKKALVGLSKDDSAESERNALAEWLEANDKQAALKKSLKAKLAELDAAALRKYEDLTEQQVKDLVIQMKWLPALQASFQSEIDRVGQTLSKRITELADRYDAPFPALNDKVVSLEVAVGKHLERMGFAWK